MTPKDLIDSTKDENAAYSIIDAFFASLPFVISLIVVPLAIFLPNLIEFDYRFSVFWPFLVIYIFAFLFLVLVGFLVSTNLKRKIFSALFFIGVFLLLSDILVPLEWGLLDGESQIKEPWHATALELLLASILIFCWLKIPYMLARNFGATLTIILLGIQIINFGLATLSHQQESRNNQILGAEASLPSPTETPVVQQANVYHIVFDGYSGPGFLDAVNKLKQSNLFTGFTFFERTLANYQVTDASVPSFLHGKLYKGGSFNSWQHEAKVGGIRRTLQNSGFSIDVYSPDHARFWTYDGAANVRTSKDISRSYFSGSDEFRLAQVAMVRVSPNIMRQEAFWLSDRLFGYVVGFLNGFESPGAFSNYGFYKRLSVPLVQEFLEDEASRSATGRYVYLHVILPHTPNVWSSDCKYTGSSSYVDQMLCSNRLMGDIIEKLKKLGRYNNSLIIFQSDHGFHQYRAEQSNLVLEPSQEARDSVASAMKYVPVDGYFRRIQPLLVIKPPFASEQPLYISSAPTQLIDIPATIYDLLGFTVPETDGDSVFSLSDSVSREIHLYSGFYTRDDKGKARILGTSMDETDLSHISYTQDNGWKVYPKLRGYSE